MAGITVIIPSLGRDTLKNTLASVAPQLHSEDAVVVITELDKLHLRELVSFYSEDSPANWTYLQREGGSWGHVNRNYAMDNHVHTSHVWTIDDDDIAAPGAMTSLRTHMDDPWTMFRMSFGVNSQAPGITCWREKRIEGGDIGTPMIFAPLGTSRFGHEYMGDFVYAQELREERGEPVWSEDVVCLIRP